ncbi:hypothetical protein AB9N12_11155 [Bacteroides sp. AN502(2024)]|uniref:hypothetical protein n=1 Tax=Bacteroides sp. AN502(2024) TaxID=3160599 RepID=UPI003514B1A8
MIGEEAPLILKGLLKGGNVNNGKKNRILTEGVYAFFRYPDFSVQVSEESIIL